MNRNKLVVIGCWLLISGLILGIRKDVYAANSIEAAINKYNISFPVKELGNCSDFDACRDYCENSANQNVCIAYAKNKGFYKVEEINEKKDEIIAQAQSELGCNSTSACKALCENEANFERCSEFAKRHNLGGGQILSPKNQDILNKAKSILGCDSPSSCKALCDNANNRERCKNFMSQAGLEVKGGPPEGKPETGPGGCNSQESCDAYCKENKDACSGFGGQQAPKPPCTGDDECRVFCMQNPAECPGFEAPQNLPGEELCPPGADCAGILDPEKGYNPETGKFGPLPSSGPEPEVQGVQTAISYYEMIKQFILRLLNFD